jgi:hypothetical protein
MRIRAVVWLSALAVLVATACGEEESSTYCVGSDLDSTFDLTRCGDAVSAEDHVIDGPGSLKALAGITSIDGSLTIEACGLTSLAGLEGLRCVSGDLIIHENKALTSLDGLEGLLYVGGSLVIGGLDQGNPQLESTAALSKLEVIEASLWVEHNRKLATLGDFGSLGLIGGFLGVFDNDALTSLPGWTALERFGGFLNLAENDRLPTCSATRLRDRFPAECRNICIRANKPDACPDDDAGCWYQGAAGGGS